MSNVLSDPQSAQAISVLASSILVPLLIAATKSVLPRLPKWAPPILAPIVGVAIDYGMSALGATSNPVGGLIAGPLGVYLREVYDQLRKASAPAPDASGGSGIRPPSV